MEHVDIFISYSSEEFDKVNMIRLVLERNGISCWMAPQDIPMGSSYANEIPAAIRKSSILLLMLSRKSQQSLFVPKEVSIALSFKKTIIPFVMEDCELTDAFNFLLIDVQRYNVFEQHSETLKLLIERIKSECTIDGNCHGNPEGNKHILLDENKSNSAIIEWISRCTNSEINRKFAKFLTKLKRKYKENPNAEEVRKWLQTEMIDGLSVICIIEQFFEMGLYSYSAVEVYLQLAVIYIHSGVRSYVKEARNYLEKTIKVLTESEVYDEVIFKRIVYARWLLAVTYKQDRNYGYAYDLCENLVDFINEENKVFDIPYADGLLLPQREIIVLHKERVMCDFLMTKIPDICYNTEELFYTQRRLFEYYILENDFTKASELLPNLMDSFSKCLEKLDAIYQVSLYQNLFEYYTYIGEKEEAQRYFDSAMTKAKQNFWKGKQKKLETLKNIYS